MPKSIKWLVKISKAATAACLQLEKDNPEVDFKKLTYDGQSFKSQIMMAIYIEMIKAGIITQENHD